jgi:hypothetical protein
MNTALTSQRNTRKLSHVTLAAAFIGTPMAMADDTLARAGLPSGGTANFKLRHYPQLEHDKSDGWL